MRLFLLLISLFWVVLQFSACDIINPEEEIPAYLYIKDYQINTNELTQGSTSHKIEDVWVYVDSRLVGVFNLPALVPVLSWGDQTVILDPNVRDNGISSLPTLYPYYERIEMIVDLQANEVDTIQPISSYPANVKFLLVEDFEENHSLTLDLDNDLETTIELTEVDAFEGFSARIELSTAHQQFTVATVHTFEDLPLNGAVPIYMELDYKTEVRFGIGVIGIDADGVEEVYYSHGLNPKGEWNKIYLNLTEVITNSQLLAYKITFAASLPDELDDATILLDNIKLLHFE